MSKIPKVVEQEINGFGNPDVPAYTPVSVIGAPTWKEIQQICTKAEDLGFKHGAVVSRAEGPSHGWTDIKNWGVIIALNRNHSNLLTPYKPIKVKFVGFTEPVDCDVDSLVIIHPIDWSTIYKRIDVQIEARKPKPPVENPMNGDPAFVDGWEYC